MEEITPVLTSIPEPPAPPAPVVPSPQGPRFDFTRLILPGAILLAAVIISGSILYGRLQAGQALVAGATASTSPGARISVSVGDSPVLGNPSAPVTMIEFSDFQCPFCRAFWSDTLPQIISQYINTGKVKLVYKNFPLTTIHPNAMLGAEAGECANAQGKFWQMHDAMFKAQAAQGTGTVTFTQADVEQWAAGAGVNQTQFNQCISNPSSVDAQINADVAAGAAAGVNGTPTFYIDGLQLVGAQPFSVFQQMIDSELATK